MIKVLVVDDSHFFRNRISDSLNSDPVIEVIGEAGDGQEAVVKAGELRPDVITMDIEMPNMDGIAAVKKIMETHPVPILMFSSLTREGADATFKALDAGAADFLTKDFKTISFQRDVTIEQLCERVRALGMPRRVSLTEETTAAGRRPHIKSAADRPSKKKFGLAVIGASTGGPVALEQLLKRLPSTFAMPVLLVQHMPSTFTLAFAERLDRLCAVEIKEAEHGDRLEAGRVYIAPGGKQTYVRKNGSGACIEIGEAPSQVTYRPCVDITFNSVANSVRQKVLAIVLTGMGSDGCAGASLLKQKGATIWAQDEASCVVYGMPMAIAKANLADSILPLDEIGQRLACLN
ncbi:MAG: chemotaxis response regulator protein-glutamate methylesterase [Gammaproteobacteria bacterium]